MALWWVGFDHKLFYLHSSFTKCMTIKRCFHFGRFLFLFSHLLSESSFSMFYFGWNVLHLWREAVQSGVCREADSQNQDQDTRVRSRSLRPIDDMFLTLWLPEPNHHWTTTHELMNTLKPQCYTRVSCLVLPPCVFPAHLWGVRLVASLIVSLVV